MKKIFLILLIYTASFSAQEFKVDKISGSVKMLRGISEQWENVGKNQLLNNSDLILTEENSYIKISSNQIQFILNSNSAIDISRVRNMSIDELLLTLAMENIRAIPKNRNSSGAKNTAVYGEKNDDKNTVVFADDRLGDKLINGARRLAESGFKKSAIAVAKETYRKHPATLNNFGDRIYFAELFIELELFDEAYEEFMNINKSDLPDEKKFQVEQKVAEIKTKLMNR